MRGSAGVITARARCNFLSARSKLPLDGVSCAASLRGQLPGVRCLHVNDVFTRTKGRDWLGIGAISLIPARLGIMPPLNASNGRDRVDRGQATCGCEIHSALHGRSVPIHFSASPRNSLSLSSLSLSLALSIQASTLVFSLSCSLLPRSHLDATHSAPRAKRATTLARKTIYYVCIRNKWNREEPRAVSPSNPIEQANGFCHRTYYPAALVNVCVARAKRRNTRDALTTAPEVYTRRLTRGNGPRESGVPQQICVPYAMFFPGDTPSSPYANFLPQEMATTNLTTFFRADDLYPGHIICGSSYALSSFSRSTTVEQSGPNGAKTNSVSQKLRRGRRKTSVYGAGETYIIQFGAKGYFLSMVRLCTGVLLAARGWKKSGESRKLDGQGDEEERAGGEGVSEWWLLPPFKI
ncbi:hypothetical protein ALC56_03162 [Trachymyrmex septentrionalis]|uniref:Uncharacterized protein n=1 Tax=Trachymyrmex septentrionalis TaxID=34720 RepID=A0A151JZU5_9HYME|nr:hypothetical protein ALC56_03162 [Trachymyrmex septentrionalis]